LTEAVDEGLIPRSPAARVGLPRTVAKEVEPKDAVAWDAADVDRFLEATAEHRWAVAARRTVVDDPTDLRSARVVQECADSQPRQRSSWSSSAEVDGKQDLGAEGTLWRHTSASSAPMADPCLTIVN
jgi:hypothetical protein